MDRSGSHHPHPGKWYCYLRNAENLGEQESSKEENSRECGNEWRKFLCSPSCGSSHGYGQGRVATAFGTSTSYERRRQ